MLNGKRDHENSDHCILSLKVGETPVKATGLIKILYSFQQEISTENICYIKYLICYFWLHLILLLRSRYFGCSCSLHEEQKQLDFKPKNQKVHKI